MKPGALILGTVVSVILLVAAGILYLMANDNSAQHYRKSISVVQQIQQHSSDWSIELARVKSDSLADFDSLASFIPRMARHKIVLSETAHNIPGLPDRLANAINAYINAVNAKEERVERFKTGYAVVRNSDRYLPLATANVLQLAQNSEDRDLERSISSLVQEIKLFLVTPSETSQTRLLTDIENLRKASVAYPTALANTLANLFSHAEVLIAKQQPTEELFREATSPQISNLANELANNLRFELRKREVELAYYDRGILAVIALLTLFWIALALHQRRRSGAHDTAPAREVPSEMAAAPRAPAFSVPGQDYSASPAVEDNALAPAATPMTPESPDSPEPAAPAQQTPGVYTDLEESIVSRFVVQCAANILAASADQISTRMDYLRQTQQHLQSVLENSNGADDMHGGAELDEEMAALAAIATSVRQEATALAELSKRLEFVSIMPNGDANRSMTDINSCIDDVVQVCGPEVAAIVTKRFGDIPEILASKSEFQILLAQLVKNAAYAVKQMDERKGVIRIDTVHKDGEIRITIIDNGKGIESESRMNIFKPFYTSRNGAMGIGLSLAGHLVKKYDGVIKINSLPGQGTVARISMPAGVPSP